MGQEELSGPAAPPAVVRPAQIGAAEARRLLLRRASDFRDLRLQLYFHPFVGLVYDCRGSRRGGLWAGLRGGDRNDLAATPPGSADRGAAPEGFIAHVAVDLVGGRAFLTAPWTGSDFVPRAEARVPGLGDAAGGAQSRTATESQTGATPDLDSGTTSGTAPGAPPGLCPAEEAPLGIADPEPRLGVAEAEASARRLIDSVLIRRRRWAERTEPRLMDGPLVFGKPNWWVTGTRRGRRVEVIVDALTGRHYAFSA
ncbi:hypothetical protein [Sediminivirga luteola]|uniref:Uncharacterized protein n=2 Tax=Sediminivirga luteola TaxID=1774748 RepID=A0A8J2XLY7_9MICO|nr:hypothetical protein [Sediminivirga luteola]GGA26974.1 hypothetical protein GCM10011333_32240 [Sediminivirga luteola]